MLKVLNLILLITIVNTASYAGDAERGSQLYSKCIECHGDQGLGNIEQQAPKIAGQHEWYIVNQLNAFKTKVRKNPKMYPYISNLTQKDYEDFAAYVANLK